jgi:elongation factor Ts
MMECKKALVEAEGDLEKAVDVLRAHGLASAAKKAGRATNEGAIFAKISEDGTAGALVELQCETDFVAMNDTFKGYGEKIADAVLAAKPADLDALNAAAAGEMTVAETVTDAIHTIGENIQLPRFAFVEQPEGAVVSYIHAGGKIGVLVEFKLGDKAFATNADFITYGRDIAMQVAATAPEAATREMVDPAVVAHEMEIYKAQAAESGKPEAIQEKIATGKLEKYYKENILTEQPFVKNGDITVAQYAAQVSKEIGDKIEIVSFKRINFGE